MSENEGTVEGLCDDYKYAREFIYVVSVYMNEVVAQKRWVLDYAKQMET